MSIYIALAIMFAVESLFWFSLTGVTEALKAASHLYIAMIVKVDHKDRYFL